MRAMVGIRVLDLIEAAVEVDCPFCNATAGQGCIDVDGRHQEFLESEGLPDDVLWAHGHRVGNAMREVSAR